MIGYIINGQFVVNLSTDEARGLASIFCLASGLLDKKLKVDES